MRPQNGFSSFYLFIFFFQKQTNINFTKLAISVFDLSPAEGGIAKPKEEKEETATSKM